MKQILGTGVAGGQGSVQGLGGGSDQKKAFITYVQIIMGGILRLRPLPMDVRYASSQLIPSRPLLAAVIYLTCTVQQSVHAHAPRCQLCLVHLGLCIIAVYRAVVLWPERFSARWIILPHSNPLRSRWTRGRPNRVSGLRFGGSVKQQGAQDCVSAVCASCPLISLMQRNSTNFVADLA
jgi:hypothetical protein